MKRGTAICVQYHYWPVAAVCKDLLTPNCSEYFFSVWFWFALISVLTTNAASWVICRTSHWGLNNGLKYYHYVPSAWKPAVLQSSWRLQNHDQWLWPVKDGGHRRRNGNSLWDPRICGWGWVDAKCDEILFLWLLKKNTLFFFKIIIRKSFFFFFPFFQLLRF